MDAPEYLQAHASERAKSLILAEEERKYEIPSFVYRGCRFSFFPVEMAKTYLFSPLPTPSSFQPSIMIATNPFSDFPFLLRWLQEI